MILSQCSRGPAGGEGCKRSACDAQLGALNSLGSGAGAFSTDGGTAAEAPSSELASADAKGCILSCCLSVGGRGNSGDNGADAASSVYCILVSWAAVEESDG